MPLNKWDIWLARVKYEDMAAIKNRPVLLLEDKQIYVISLKMTKTPPRSSYEYDIQDWHQAGLNYSTTVSSEKILRLTPSDLIHRLGSLSPYDRMKLARLLNML